MTLNTSGPISLGGTTAGQSIAVENGGPGTAQISLNCTAVRSLAGVPGTNTTIIMPTNFYGKSNSAVVNITISASTQNYCVYSAVSTNPAYVAGSTAATVTIAPGVVVGTASTGSYAMLVPASFNPGDTVTIVNNGYIVGAGGSGGAGAVTNPAAGQNGNPGLSGGNALYVNRATTVTNNGTIGAGGGGGGGGGSARNQTPRVQTTVGGNGGGGGAGNNTGPGGAAGPAGTTGFPVNPGTPGTLTCGGAGGTGTPGCGYYTGGGGNGGGLGNAGSPGTAVILPIARGPFGSGGSGGSSANYITGNSFVTWPTTGTRLGGVA